MHDIFLPLLWMILAQSTCEVMHDIFLPLLWMILAQSTPEVMHDLSNGVCVDTCNCVDDLDLPVNILGMPVVENKDVLISGFYVHLLRLVECSAFQLNTGTGCTPGHN